MNFQSALANIDSYKLGHGDQYPPGTTKVYSNFTPRSDIHFAHGNGSIVWFGIQGFLHELRALWDETFFKRNVDEVCSEYAALVAPFCGPRGFNANRLRQLHALGYLPLEIKALPEGSIVPMRVPVLTITNTVAHAYWLPNFLETTLSADLWKSSTSATISRRYRQLIDEWADVTGGSKEFVQWQGHDFSPRGMSGMVDAAKSGAGHLLSFTGSDNIPALQYINTFYHGKSTFVAGSVPATEHSVMSSSIILEMEKIRKELEENPNLVL